MRFGKFIISLILLSSILFSTSIAIDEEWMMKKYPNWLPELPVAEKHAYCYSWQEQLYATTSYFDLDVRNLDIYKQLLEQFNQPRNTTYYPFKNEYLPEDIQNQIGDTLVMTDGVNYYNVLLESCGGLIDADMSQPTIALQPLDSLPYDIDWQNRFLLLNKNSLTLKTIKPIREIEVKSNKVEIFLDSMKNEAKNKILDFKHHYIKSSYVDSFVVKYYGVSEDTEIFFISLEGFNLKDESAYHAVFYCYLQDEIIKFLLLKETLYQSHKYDITCALNINNDRYIDYLIKTDYGTGIITIRRGQLNYIDFVASHQSN